MHLYDSPCNLILANSVLWVYVKTINYFLWNEISFDFFLFRLPFSPECFARSTWALWRRRPGRNYRRSEGIQICNAYRKGICLLIEVCEACGLRTEASDVNHLVLNLNDVYTLVTLRNVLYCLYSTCSIANVGYCIASPNICCLNKQSEW